MLCGYAIFFNEESQVQNRIAASVRKEAHVRLGDGVLTCDVENPGGSVPPGISVWAFCIQGSTLAMGHS